MRTAREAKIPSARMGQFNYQSDRHYVLVQRAGPDWEYDTFTQYMNTFDPVTGERAYRIEADGAEGDGAMHTGKANAVLLSCSKEYADRKNREAVLKSKQMKDADFSLGPIAGGSEWAPEIPEERETTLGDAVETMQQALRRQGREASEFGSPELSNL